MKTHIMLKQAVLMAVVFCACSSNGFPAYFLAPPQLDTIDLRQEQESSLHQVIKNRLGEIEKLMKKNKKHWAAKKMKTHLRKVLARLPEGWIKGTPEQLRDLNYDLRQIQHYLEDKLIPPAPSWVSDPRTPPHASLDQIENQPPDFGGYYANARKSDEEMGRFWGLVYKSN